MKNEKSPGEDGIPKEFYDKYYHLFEDELYYLYNNILIDKEQPSSQKNALVKLLFKKGDYRELNKSCQKPTTELAGRLREKLNISP